MNREAMLQLVRSMTRDATVFIVALLLFIGGVAVWQATAPILFLALLIAGIRAWKNFRNSLQQYYAGISKWPPLSCEDCRVARSKLKRKADQSSPRYF